MPEQDFRKKITWINLFCCLTVICNHAINTGLFFPQKNAPDWLVFLEEELIPWLIRFNVPCFIMISAYLFYRNYEAGLLGAKWRRRAKSLLLPYLLWNLLYYLGYLAADRIPWLSELIGRPMTFRAADLVRAVLLYAYNPVFWFLFQVILLVGLTPLLYEILRRRTGAAAFLLLLLILGHYRIEVRPLNLDALFYYSLAAAAALHGKSLAEKAWSEKRAWTGLVLVEWGYLCSMLYYRTYWIPGILLFHGLAIPGLWLLLPERLLGEPRDFMKQTFFVYAFHFIPTRFLGKLLAACLPENAVVACLLYLTMPLLILGFCTVIAAFLKRCCPFVWKLLSGFR